MQNTNSTPQRFEFVFGYKYSSRSSKEFRKMQSFSVLVILFFNILRCRGAADFDVERFDSPYVDNRDLGPLMSQQPAMQSESFDTLPYRYSSNPARSSSSSYQYQYGHPCTNCNQGHSSSSSSYGSYSNYGSLPSSSSSSYQTGGYGGNFYNQPPVQTSSSRHEVKEEEEFVNGQQVYDLHHEKRFKDGHLVYNNKKEKGPDEFGGNPDTYHSGYTSYNTPHSSNYGSSGYSNSYGYQEASGSESSPVKFESPPRTPGSSQQSYSSHSNYGSSNVHNPSGDKFHRGFDAEIQRLREQMRQRTRNYHKNSLAQTPVSGTSHRSEYRTQTKYINGKPVYSKEEERKYKDGQLIHDVTKENDEGQDLNPEYSYPYTGSTNRAQYQQRIETSKSRSHNPIASYPSSYYGQSYERQNNVHRPLSSHPTSSYTGNAQSQTFSSDNNAYSPNSGLTHTRPAYNSQSSSYYEKNYRKSDAYPYTNDNHYSSSYNEQQNRISQDQNMDLQSSMMYPQRQENNNEKATSISYNSHSSSHYRPPVKESSVVRHETEGVRSIIGISPTYTANNQDLSEEEEDKPSYAAYIQQPLDEQPDTEPVNPEVTNTDDGEKDKIEEDKGRYDISPYDGEDRAQHRETEPTHPGGELESETFENTQTYEQSNTDEHPSIKETIPVHQNRREYQTYESTQDRIYPSQENTETYHESRTSQHQNQREYGKYGSSSGLNQKQIYPTYLKSYEESSTNQDQKEKQIPNFNTYPGQGRYSSYNRSQYEHHINNLLPSKWVETRTTWQYVNGLLVSEIQFHKYYENGILVHENTTERSRDQMIAEGVDVVNLDLTPSELALYGAPGPARTHSQKHELHQVKRFKNGQPIYELNHERLFQDGNLVHEDHKEKHAEDFLEHDSGNHQLMQSQRLNQHSVAYPGTITGSGLHEREGFSLNPTAYVRRHEIRQEQEYVDGQKIYDLHHEKEYKDGQLVNENRTELGPEELGVKDVSHKDALKDILAGRSPYQITDRALNQQQQSSHGILKTSCVTCHPGTGGIVGIEQRSNLHSSVGSQSASPAVQGYGKESSYKKEFEVEEHYENGKLVKGKEEKTHWRDGHLVDHDSDTYYQGPSRVTNIPHDVPPLNSPPAIAPASERASTSYNMRKRTRCPTNPCQNGGRCRMSVAGEVCLCRFGFRGNRCEEAYCPNRYCRHSGTCSIVAGEHECECPEGFKGQRCATREVTISLGASG